MSGDTLGCPHWHLVEIKIREFAQHSIMYQVSHLIVSCTPGVTTEKCGWHVLSLKQWSGVTVDVEVGGQQDATIRGTEECHGQAGTWHI